MKMNLKERFSEEMEWIHPAQDKNKLLFLVDAVINLLVV
jgi:hypothetical protein